MNKHLLREFIKESIRLREVTLSNGKIVEYGSSSHIGELERMIKELDSFRRQLRSKALRKERYTISRAIDSLRLIRNRARKSGIKTGLIVEDD